MLFGGPTKLLLLVLFLCVPFSFGYSKNSTFREANVADFVRVKFPAHWHMRDIDERKNIAASAEAALATVSGLDEAAHVSGLSVVSTPFPSGAILRVSIVDGGGLTQKELSAELQRDRSATLAEVTKVFHRDVILLGKVLNKQGVSLVGKETVGTAVIDGVLALTLSYRRTGIGGGSDFNVTQYNFPLGQRKIIMTTSYRISDQLLLVPIIDYIKASLSFSRPL